MASKVLVVDIGGTSVRILASGQKERREFPSGKDLTPAKMVAGVRKLAEDWEYDAVPIGYPGPVREGRPAVEPHNLARGWVGFEFEAAFGCPVKVIDDAATQALGSYRRGTMLFLGLGAAPVVEGAVVPLELGHLSIGKKTFEEDLGVGGLKRLGRKEWQKGVEVPTKRFVNALLLDDAGLGGGNAKILRKLPKESRAGDDADAFLGGFRLREDAKKGARP